MLESWPPSHWVSLEGVNSDYKTQGAKMRIISSGWWWIMFCHLEDGKKPQRRWSGSSLQMVCTHSENGSIIHVYLLGDEMTLQETSMGGWMAWSNLQKSMLRILAFTLPSIQSTPERGRGRRARLVSWVCPRSGKADATRPDKADAYCITLNILNLTFYPLRVAVVAISKQVCRFHVGAAQAENTPQTGSAPLVSCPIVSDAVLCDAHRNPLSTHLCATQKCRGATIDQ